MRRMTGTLLALALGMLWPARGAVGAGETNGVADAPIRPAPYESVYKGYRPVGWSPAGTMALSSEQHFFSLTLLSESERAYALVAAALEQERAGRYGEAMDIYQKVIDEYADVLYRVSEYGVFVPIATYCQLRLLGLPPHALRQYRVKHDARAQEAYRLAARRHSLEGLAQVRDSMLATSFGASAITTLGYAALDRGNYQEALEYFQAAWEYDPQVRAGNPRLALAMQLCRRMLGRDTGSAAGPVGHWKLDEREGRRARDAGPYGLHGVVTGRNDDTVPFWTAGKVDGAFLCGEAGGGRASIAVPASGFFNIGSGGSDFSIALWVQWEDSTYPNSLFARMGHNRAQAFRLEVRRDRRLQYTLATESPKWETGVTDGRLEKGRWAHVALVKKGLEVRVFIDGKLETRDMLKAPTVINTHAIVIGGGVVGKVDDVRLYKRALLDREVAGLAGTLGTATMAASAVSGQAPLTVSFSCPEAEPGTRYFWESGDGVTAEGPVFQHTYRLGGMREAVVTLTHADGRIASARQKLAVGWASADRDFGERMERVLAAAKPDVAETTAQMASAPNVAADDYVQMPPTPDPLGLKEPEWSVKLPGTRLDCLVFSHPVITKRSVIVRHKNIVYSFSLLSGNLRWKHDLGGRIAWQQHRDRQFPHEGVLVQDGLVFTPMFKVGPTLVALDEITGEVRWAYGPMVAGSEEEARMRFEAAPTGGPGTIYAGYVLDAIEGQTHVDSEYGVMAFEAATGRVLWRQEINRLRPGKFRAGFAARRRNRIRSFLSPPLFKEGTVYHCTNAGALAALDALSGKIKWVMRYPYYIEPSDAHDATAPFGKAAHTAGHSPYLVYAQSPMFWFHQRPFLQGDALYVLPVDSPAMLKVDRRSGKVIWQKRKGEGIKARHTDGGWAYFLGPTPGGELAIVYSFRAIGASWRGPYQGGGVHLIDPVTGKTVWELGDWVKPIDHPFLTRGLTEGLGADYAYRSQSWPQMITARPFLSSDGRINFMSLYSQGWPKQGWEYNLAVVDLGERKIVAQRRHVSAEFIKQAAWSLEKAPDYLERLESLTHKDDKVKGHMETLNAILDRGTVPSNAHGPWLPFSRVTAERWGSVFEVRMGPRTIEAVYDKAQVQAELAGREDPEAMFARAELAIADGRLTEAARLIQQCLAVIPMEDLGFRALLNQQLYPTYKELARTAVLAGRGSDELAHGIGMTRTVGTLPEEMETLLVLSEAYERQANWQAAATLARHLVNRYGQFEMKISALRRGDVAAARRTSVGIVDGVGARFRETIYGKEIDSVTAVMQKGMDLYFSALSPLDKELTVRAGELGVKRLLALQARFPRLGEAMEAAAVQLAQRSEEEQLARLWEFAGTAAVQTMLDRLLETTGLAAQDPAASMENRAALRRREWLLADMARLCGAVLPEQVRARLLAPRESAAPAPVREGLKRLTTSLEEARSPVWMVLDRQDAGRIEPDLLFLGGRVKTRVDNKFLLYAFDARSHAIRWKASEERNETWSDQIRLDGVGDEPGFAEAFVYGDCVVVHGRYDVLAFRLDDGRLKWRYRVPFAFEIEHAALSGDLLVLVGEAATVTLFLGTDDPRGEVAWQEREEGMPYAPPYFHGDLLVGLRRMPFNLTVRYRATGRLIGRLELPDLLLNDENPLIDKGPTALPMARDGERLVVSDGRYYLMLDVAKLRVLWKRLIDGDEGSGSPPLRLAMQGDYLAVVKRDYDVKAIHMLSSQTGELLWRTDPKAAGSPRPIDAMTIHKGRIYGIRPHVGQGFYFTALDCQTGKPLFANEQSGYDGIPDVNLLSSFYGDVMVARIRDRQTFELKAFRVGDGKLLHTLSVKSTGDFDEHGRASTTVQNGHLVLLGKDDLILGQAPLP